MIVPPAPTAGADAPRSPREAVFIIDTSGSMEGTSIKQAKQALQMALDRLQPGDRFNVIEFNSVTQRAVRRADAGRPEHARAGAAVRRGAARARRHRDEARARSGADATTPRRASCARSCS